MSFLCLPHPISNLLLLFIFQVKILQKAKYQQSFKYYRNSFPSRCNKNLSRRYGLLILDVSKTTRYSPGQEAEVTGLAQ